MAFKIIEPITITDTILTGSNVPESDYQEFDPGTAYAVKDTVIVATSTANVHKIYECSIAQSAGLTADLLDEDCSDISDWTDWDNSPAVSEVSPTGQFRFDTNLSAVVHARADRVRTLADAVPNTFTIQMKTYFDAIGTLADGDCFYLYYANSTWMFVVAFASDGLYVFKTGAGSTEVGTNIVKCNNTAAWQYWRFQVDKTTESAATVEVFKKEEGGEWESQGTVDCDYEIASTNKRVRLTQSGDTTNDRISHVDYIKIATGLGLIEDTSTTPVGSTSWLEIDSTNRWKSFNGVLGSQAEQATKIEYILTPGEVIDSVALLNLESDTVDIVEIDTADALLNETAWTGATGTTQSTGWNKVGTPSNYTIDGGMIKITADAANEGQSKTVAVTPGTEYQLLGLYKNTSGDIAQIGIFDNTHSADILATTDLASSTANASFSHVFTAPVGCASVEIKLMAKSAGDIVWFDSVILAPTEYSETVTTGTSKTDVVKTDIPEIATGILTVTINKSGTAAIGELIIGNVTSLGTMRYSPQVGITNYSTKTQDTFGNWTIIERGYSKKLSCNLRLANTSLDSIFKTLSDYKDQLLVWIGDPSYSCLIVYGFYKDFQIVIPYKNFADCSLEIEGMI